MYKSTNKSYYFLNRELSALAFNRHVLYQATDKSVPLLEQLRFLFICSLNLDEFFEIRVAGLKEKIAMNLEKASIDGLTPKQTLQEISGQAHKIYKELYQVYNEVLIPKLEKAHICFLKPDSNNRRLRKYCENYFNEQVLPVLSPIGLDIAHPFPKPSNKSLNFIVSLEGRDAFGRETQLAIIHAPRSLPRVIKVPSDIMPQGDNFIFLTDLIKNFTGCLFPGLHIKGCYQFRLTRNSDLFLDEEEIEDLAKALKRELRQRNYGDVVRLEIESECPLELVKFLQKEHNLHSNDIYLCNGPVNINRYMSIIELTDREDLKYAKFTPSMPNELIKHPDIFNYLKQDDLLIHHPYQSFDTVISFIRQAMQDENVLAIKQTLYRTHKNSKMVIALIEAARAGKEVTAVIELKARFDEESNLLLAEKLHKAGVLVLYGIIGYKIHAKMTLVVRKEAEGLRRYVHLGTGNYHEHTARSYVDLGLMTSDEQIGLDVQTLFHQLTGLGKIQKLNKLISAPFSLCKIILKLIDKEIINAQNNKPALIIIKVNGLTDKTIIQALYKASQAGVKIKLIIRTLCRLRPNINGISDNIKVISIIDRFLEHSRIFYFLNNGDEKIYCSSSDLMERNLYHRVEVCFPIEAQTLKKRIKDEILDPSLSPLQKRWELCTNGRYCHHGKQSNQETILKKYT